MLIFLSMLETDAERQVFLGLYHEYGNARMAEGGAKFF